MQNTQTMAREVSEKTHQAIRSALVGKVKFHLYREGRYNVSPYSYRNTKCGKNGAIDLRGNMNRAVEEGGRIANSTPDNTI